LYLILGAGQLCTVLKTFGSSQRPPGTMMVIRNDGFYWGSLSGGYMEMDLITRIGEDILSSPCQIIRYGKEGYKAEIFLPLMDVLKY